MVKGEALTFIDCNCSFECWETYITAFFFTQERVTWVNSAQQDTSFSGTLFILVLLSLLPGFFLEILFTLTLKLPHSTILSTYKI
jgi:hypothetical protein